MRSVYRKLHDLAVSFRHIISEGFPILHRGAHVRVPHQLLLHANRCANRVEPAAVRVPERVSAEAADACCTVVKRQSQEHFCDPWRGLVPDLPVEAFSMLMHLCSIRG